MAQERPRRNKVEGPEVKGKDAAAERKSGIGKEGISQSKENFATAVINSVGEMFNSRNERIKKASKEMGNVRLGFNMAGAGIILALAGMVALPFWGMKKILEVDKHFMAGLNFMK